MQPTLATLVRLAILPALVGALGAAPARAAEPPRDEKDTVLHLTETAGKDLKRDRLRAVLRAEAVGPNAKQVQADINKRMTSALERVHAIAALKAETGGYSVYQETPPNAPPRWRGSQSLSVYGGDVGQILAVAGDLQSDGLIMSALNFELAPETARAAQDDLTAEALQRLHQRADRVASALQMSVARLRDVRVGNVDDQRGPVPLRMMRGEALGQAAAAPPVAEAGDAHVAVSVEADIVLTPLDPHQP